ncbi:MULTISPECIES: sensor histidine kinase [Microbacterium]|uniref:Histidine kinase n=1 Tax=Microbacterium wangchenii TaxID=2541726 RepID=A0ABX5SS19_9MICO|nr:MULTISPECIES: histidine kinase [Microbacterium]MCK6068394.1 hypothetical protein [Microbacterium sp. EYE_512]QBR87665.1 histidine kinase [Microbacterium wangchenii]
MILTAPADRVSERVRRARLLSLVWLSTTVLSSLLMPGVGLLRETRPAWIALGAVGIAGFALTQAGVLYDSVTPQARTRVRPAWQVAFGVAAALSTVLVGPVAAGAWQTWAWIGAAIVGTLPLLLRPVLAAAGTLAACAVALVVAAVTGGSPLQSLLIVVLAGGGLAFVNLGPVWLWNLLSDAHAGREAVAALAVDQERLRFARDVHDLLGHTLSVIALKAEVIERGPDAPHARAEAAAIRRLAASALTEVRAAVADSRRVDLAAEVGALGQVLQSSGIACTIHVDPAAAGHRDAVLAPIAREAVTNVLRHSTATHCVISLTSDGTLVRLLVTNDGVAFRGHDLSGDASSGGLDGMRERLREAGGRLEVERRNDEFELRASVGVRA